MKQQQLVARIKRSSKYLYQAPPGRWFDATIADKDDYCDVRGNNNVYWWKDVALGVRLADGTVIELKS